MRVAIVYVPEQLTPFREHISSNQLATIQDSLRRASWDSIVLEYDPLAITSALSACRPSVVLNLAYGYCNPRRNIHQSQAAVAAKLEESGLPIVGSSARVQHIAQDKIQCAEKLRAHGVNSPRCFNVGDLGQLPPLAIRKPRYGACHRGVSLVDSKMIESQELHAEDLMFQEYIDGREFTVAVVEVDGNPVVLPALEVVFKRSPHVMVSGDSDWDMKPVFPENRSLAQTARRVFSRLQMRDYARIDIRMRNRDMYVLDVNSLPNLDPERSYVPLAAKCVGLSFARLIKLLITSSLYRASRNTRHPGQQLNGVRKQ